MTYDNMSFFYQLADILCRTHLMICVGFSQLYKFVKKFRILGNLTYTQIRTNKNDWNLDVFSIININSNQHSNKGY